MTEHIQLPHGLTATYITHAAADARGDEQDGADLHDDPALFDPEDIW
ncbi:hypothetical protein [Tsukamurella pseudospumae]|nr:hypothetical protein [Tsukamurella pseudospumae]